MLDKVHDVLKDQRLVDKNITMLRDLISMIGMVKSNRYITIDSQDELDVYARYITYRIQQDFYDLGRECGEFSDMSWMEGIGLVESIFLFGEIAQYRRLLGQGSKCSWSEFLAQLEEKGPLWNQVSMAFHDALARLDFKLFWQSEKLAKRLTQMATQGV